LLAFVLTALTLSLASATPSHAQTTCSCPWEVKQLNDTQTPGSESDCPLLDHNNQQNASFWADYECSGRGNACTYVYSTLSCTENPDGSVTDSGLVNYKCNWC
jgi:hypothetical protein